MIHTKVLVKLNKNTYIEAGYMPIINQMYIDLF